MEATGADPRLCLLPVAAPRGPSCAAIRSRNTSGASLAAIARGEPFPRGGLTPGGIDNRREASRESCNDKQGPGTNHFV